MKIPAPMELVAITGDAVAMCDHVVVFKTFVGWVFTALSEGTLLFVLGAEGTCRGVDLDVWMVLLFESMTSADVDAMMEVADCSEYDGMVTSVCD